MNDLVYEHTLADCFNEKLVPWHSSIYNPHISLSNAQLNR